MRATCPSCGGRDRRREDGGRPARSFGRGAAAPHVRIALTALSGPDTEPDTDQVFLLTRSVTVTGGVSRAERQAAVTQGPYRAGWGRLTGWAGAMLVALGLAACEGGTIVVRGEAPVPVPAPRPPVVVVEPPPPPVGALRVKEIRAEYVRARVIYAKEVEAAELRVGRIVRVREREAKRWGGGEKVRAATVQADEIYARKIKARVVEAGILYVHEIEDEDD